MESYCYKVQLLEPQAMILIKVSQQLNQGLGMTQTESCLSAPRTAVRTSAARG